jgi:methyl-accepting chemotaxis protein
MNANSQDMEKLIESANTVEADINETSLIMNSATSSSERTVHDYIETGNNIDQIVQKIEQAAKNSISNAKNIESISGAAEHLNRLTEELNNVLGKFKT